MANLVKEIAEENGADVSRPVMVCSAMGPSTNRLLAAGEKALLEGVVDTADIRAHTTTALNDLGLGKEVDDQIVELLDELNRVLTGVSMLKELSKRTLDYLVSFGERMSVRIMAAYVEVCCCYTRVLVLLVLPLLFPALLLQRHCACGVFAAAAAAAATPACSCSYPYPPTPTVPLLLPRSLARLAPLSGT